MTADGVGALSTPAPSPLPVWFGPLKAMEYLGHAILEQTRALYRFRFERPIAFEQAIFDRWRKQVFGGPPFVTFVRFQAPGEETSKALRVGVTFLSHHELRVVRHDE